MPDIGDIIRRSRRSAKIAIAAPGTPGDFRRSRRSAYKIAKCVAGFRYFVEWGKGSAMSAASFPVHNARNNRASVYGSLEPSTLAHLPDQFNDDVTFDSARRTSENEAV